MGRCHVSFVLTTTRLIQNLQQSKTEMKTMDKSFNILKIFFFLQCITSLNPGRSCLMQKYNWGLF